jgi:hypothetical protein
MVVLRENISLCTALVSRDCPCNVARNCCLGGVCACVFVSVCVARSTVIMSYITLKLLLDRSLPAASCNMLYTECMQDRSYEPGPHHVLHTPLLP